MPSGAGAACRKHGVPLGVFETATANTVPDSIVAVGPISEGVSTRVKTATNSWDVAP